MIDFIAEPHRVAYLNRPLRCRLDRCHDVALPVPLAGRHVSRQHEVLQGSQRNVMRAPDPGLQHAAAPHRYASRMGYVVNLLGFGKSSHASQLNIYDASRTHSNRLLRMMRATDAFVQADGSIETSLQFRVIDDLVVSQRLLDHHEVELVEMLQPRRV